MTISAQQPQVPVVGSPVFKTPAPIVAARLMPNLLARVDVVNVEGANVRKAAARALPTKAGNQFELFSPVVRVLCHGVPVPPRFLAGWAAKLRGTLCAALPADAGAAPSGFKIAGLAAIFSGAVLNPVGVHLSCGAAVLAGDFYSLFSHARSISKYVEKAIPGYFEIACKRIAKAYEQPDFFVEQAKVKAEQLDMLGAAE